MDVFPAVPVQHVLPDRGAQLELELCDVVGPLNLANRQSLTQIGGPIQSPEVTFLTTDGFKPPVHGHVYTNGRSRLLFTPPSDATGPWPPPPSNQPPFPCALIKTASAETSLWPCRPHLRLDPGHRLVAGDQRREPAPDAAVDARLGEGEAAPARQRPLRPERAEEPEGHQVAV